MRLALLALLSALVLSSGCATYDDLVGEGSFESPCGVAGACDADHVCLMTDGFASCSPRCGFDGNCPSGYACNSSQSICSPINDPVISLEEHRLCGAGFSTCSSGLACADFGAWGERCSRIGCLRAPSLCWSGCCVSVGAGDTSGVCAPPSYCE